MADTEVTSPRSHTPKGRAAKDRILKASEPLFADRGFHGASMRDIAVAAELPLATVVYHFTTKERLYRSILVEIADALSREMDAAKGGEPSEAFARGLVRWSLANPGRVRLLLRELLDNPSRVSRAASLPLAPVLQRFAAEAQAVDKSELAVLHLVGAVSYVVAAWPTVKRIVGSKREKELMRDYEADAMKLARQVLGISKRKEGKR